jgi:hypothetical protein
MQLLDRVLVKAGQVLLVDYMVDSGWIFTVADFKLWQAGSGQVFPLRA